MTKKLRIGENFLNVNIYKFPLGECTGGGVTAHLTSTTMFYHCTREEAIQYCQEHDIKVKDQLFLVERKLWGEDHFFAEPLVKPDDADECNQCFGGNYIMTDDSRFPHQNGLKIAYPIPVHDRYEHF